MDKQHTNTITLGFLPPDKTFLAKLTGFLMELRGYDYRLTHSFLCVNGTVIHMTFVGKFFDDFIYTEFIPKASGNFITAEGWSDDFLQDIEDRFNRNKVAVGVGLWDGVRVFFGFPPKKHICHSFCAYLLGLPGKPYKPWDVYQQFLALCLEEQQKGHVRLVGAVTTLRSLRTGQSGASPQAVQVISRGVGV
jgi:hypothetical protein